MFLKIYKCAEVFSKPQAETGKKTNKKKNIHDNCWLTEGSELKCKTLRSTHIAFSVHNWTVVGCVSQLMGHTSIVESSGISHFDVVLNNISRSQSNNVCDPSNVHTQWTSDVIVNITTTVIQAPHYVISAHRNGTVCNVAFDCVFFSLVYKRATVCSERNANATTHVTSILL